MDDREFIALSPVEAYEYAIQKDAPERVRLLALYHRSTGDVAHPRASLSTSQDEAEEGYPAVENGPRSLMLSIGRGGFVVSVIVMVLVIFAALAGNISSTSMVLLLFAASVVGLFAFMWMMGALEMRLIEINQTLKGSLEEMKMKSASPS